ncbi:hypothetical protein SETIT_7G067900v2 [Setaria italica]|uniref:Uncharacterized protein n=1 Tax=Setaria italica TaxID=4555 RepID=A0A368RSY5_SETIT|nr:hypothetical protein SETIT_7G067900v2 [Setaria italica]
MKLLVMAKECYEWETLGKEEPALGCPEAFEFIWKGCSMGILCSFPQPGTLCRITQGAKQPRHLETNAEGVDDLVPFIFHRATLPHLEGAGTAFPSRHLVHHGREVKQSSNTHLLLSPR